MPYKPNEREYRSAELSVAQEEGDELQLFIEPIVFNSRTLLWKDGDEEVYEMIMPGALDECDRSDFIFNRNHGENDSTVFARSKNGSIVTEIDDRSMRCTIRLDKKDARHVQLHGDVVAKRITGASFAFSRDYEYEYESETRTIKITKIKKLYDISAVDFPAYEAATVSARSSLALEQIKGTLKSERARRKRKLMLAIDLI